MKVLRLPSLADDLEEVLIPRDTSPVPEIAASVFERRGEDPEERTRCACGRTKRPSRARCYVCAGALRRLEKQRQSEDYERRLHNLIRVFDVPVGSPHGPLRRAP